MAKKRVEEPVYPDSPLVINKERFCSLLKEQIEKGAELLKIDVPVIPQQSAYYGFGAVRDVNQVQYEESAEKSLAEDYKRWRDRNKAIYRNSFEAPESIYYHEYETQIWRIWGTNTVKEYRENIQRQMNHMQGDIERVDLLKCVALPTKQIESEETTGDVAVISNEVFIVHGHCEEMKQIVARVVSKLGLKPIILHEQANGGRTIIDKFETNAKGTHFAIILLSADDCAASIKDLEEVEDTDVRGRLEKRARQNVVFEMGYFAGKLGFSNLFLLLQEGVSKPGDLDGIVYTIYDKYGAWKMDLVRELQNVGYHVSADKLIY